MSPMILQGLSMTGAVLVLFAYAASQYAGLRGDGITYGLLNVVGSAMLALSAFAPLNAGVFTVEAAWSLLSLGVTLRAWQRRHIVVAPPVQSAYNTGG
jgi:hypothetical protein